MMKTKMKNIKWKSKKNFYLLVPGQSQVTQEICLASLLLNYLNVMQIQLSKKSISMMNLIPGQRKKFKEKNLIKNFKKILMKERSRHKTLRIPKRRQMEKTKRINKQKGRKMKKQSPKRKVMMMKKEVRLRKRQNMRYFLSCKKSKKLRKSKEQIYFLIQQLKSF